MNNDEQRLQTQLQLEKLRVLGPLSLAETRKVAGVGKTKALKLRAMLRNERQEPSKGERFSQLLSQLRDMGQVSHSEACKALRIGHTIYTKLRAEIRKERCELTSAERFKANLEQMRAMSDQRREAVCRSLSVNRKTYGRLRVALRAESNEATPIEAFRANLERVRQFIGDRHPTAVARMEIAKGVGITPDKAARARDVIMRERLATEREAVKLHAEPPPKRRKVDWLFRVEGDRLFSMNREPMEVGS